MKSTHGMHHLQKRKRVYKKLEPYPHPDKWKRFLDRIIYIAGLIGPLMTLDQIYRIWVQQNASGVSVLSWFTYFVIAFIWVAYGIAHKEKPIILIYSIWIVLDAFIVVGTLMFG